MRMVDSEISPGGRAECTRVEGRAPITGVRLPDAESTGLWASRIFVADANVRAVRTDVGVGTAVGRGVCPRPTDRETDVRRKGVLTTGQVAEICQVAPRTVSKWFDSGELKGYRVPGSKDRRIPVNDLIRFLRRHGMPLGALDSGKTRILVVDRDGERAESLVSSLARHESCEVEAAASAFGAGIAGSRFAPHVILVDVAIKGLRRTDLSITLSDIPDLSHVKVVAMTSEARTADELKAQGFDACLVRPCGSREVLGVVDSLLLPA